MNTFYEHHKNSIRFQYRCFDRILLNGLIQPFQQEERVVGFFGTYRDLYPVSRDMLRQIATQFQNWVVNRSQKWGAPILDAPEGRRDDFVQQYFKAAKPDQVVCILKAREPARILAAIGTKKENRWHLELKQRWVVQYNFYLNDSEWGRMFVRICPYFPFSARVCLNQHHWIANRLKKAGIRFRQTTNAFSGCSNPQALQDVADSLTAKDLSRCGRKWLFQLTPFFTERERKQAGVEHRLFFSQVEYCDNLIFSRRAAVDQLSQRLLDANRTIGQPNKITVIFGRKIQKHHAGKLQTVIEDLDLPNPVIRSHYKNGFIKQYVRDKSNLRTEPATNNVTDYGVAKLLRICPTYVKNSRASSTGITTFSRIFWSPSLTANSFAHSPSPPFSPMANGFLASSSIIPDNWHSCMHWSVSLTLPLRIVSPPRRFMPTLPTRLTAAPTITHSHRFDTIFRSYAPKVSLNGSTNPDAID